MKTIVITDSTSYLPQEIINKYNVKIVPLNVHFAGEVFKECITYSNQEYYELLRSSAEFPSTSQPSAGEFLEIFEQLNSGDEALAILVSSKLSGTFQSANIARGLLSKKDIKITLLDSGSSGMGLGFQVIEACEYLEDNKTVEQVMERLAEIRNRMRLFFVVDNLEYLARGGRLSRISCKLGTLLQLKPILSIENGDLTLFQKVRTMPRAMATVLGELDKAKDSLSKISILNVEYQQKAKELKQQLQQKYKVPVSICDLGPVTGSHLGPGSLGIVFY